MNEATVGYQSARRRKAIPGLTGTVVFLLLLAIPHLLFGVAVIGITADFARNHFYTTWNDMWSAVMLGGPSLLIALLMIVCAIGILRHSRSALTLAQVAVWCIIGLIALVAGLAIVSVLSSEGMSPMNASLLAMLVMVCASIAVPHYALILRLNELKWRMHDNG